MTPHFGQVLPNFTQRPHMWRTSPRRAVESLEYSASAIILSIVVVEFIVQFLKVEGDSQGGESDEDCCHIYVVREHSEHGGEDTQGG